MPATIQKHVDAVLFDLYGTLVDIEIDTSSATTWARFSRELAAADIHLSPECLRERYTSLVKAEQRVHGQAFVLDARFFHKLLYDPASRASEAVVTFFGRRFRSLTTRTIQLRDYALPLLAALKGSGCKVGLVSNTEGIVTDHDLETLNLHGAFDSVVLSARVGMKKPYAGIFHFALRDLDVRPERALFVGDDHTADFEGAKRAGLSPVLLCPADKSAPVKCTKPTLDGILAALEHRGWMPPADVELPARAKRVCCSDFSPLPVAL